MLIDVSHLESRGLPETMQDRFMFPEQRVVINILDRQHTLFVVCRINMLWRSWKGSYIDLLTPTHWLASLDSFLDKWSSWLRLWPWSWYDRFLLNYLWFINNRMLRLFPLVDPWDLFILWPFCLLVDSLRDLRINLLFLAISIIALTLERVLYLFLFVQVGNCSRECICFDLCIMWTLVNWWELWSIWVFGVTFVWVPITWALTELLFDLHLVVLFL